MSCIWWKIQKIRNECAGWTKWLKVVVTQFISTNTQKTKIRIKLSFICFDSLMIKYAWKTAPHTHTHTWQISSIQICSIVKSWLSDECVEKSSTLCLFLYYTFGYISPTPNHSWVWVMKTLFHFRILNQQIWWFYIHEREFCACFVFFWVGIVRGFRFAGIEFIVIKQFVI